MSIEYGIYLQHGGDPIYMGLARIVVCGIGSCYTAGMAKAKPNCPHRRARDYPSRLSRSTTALHQRWNRSECGLRFFEYLIQSVT